MNEKPLIDVIIYNRGTPDEVYYAVCYDAEGRMVGWRWFRFDENGKVIDVEHPRLSSAIVEIKINDPF